ncbi:hypothetical protein NDU88_001180 [Pleurodeles waltl]|uniref:Uncharacterized protein n=1 Tax=Pleurodeles waltl TaxID=8319 RepID=A0AAV7V9E6_PLEWA|nr:hypothetical protein NDU88_001180 [Pleurodeles waltl]
MRRWEVSRRNVKWTQLWSVQCRAEVWLKKTCLLAEKIGSSVFSGDVGGGVHQLFEAEVGEVVEQGGGVGVVVLFQMEVEVA